jgi:hypothetical protein
MIKTKKYKIIWLSAGILLICALFLLMARNSRDKVEFTKTQAENTVPENNISANDTTASDVSSPASDAEEPQDSTSATSSDGNNKPIDNSTPNNNTTASNATDKNNEAAVAATNSPKIISRLVSWGFQASNGRKIDTIIIHSTYNAVGSDPFSLDDIINKEYKPNGVSPHYIIDRSGNIYQLVEDKNIAYHAGESKMPDGRTNVNNFSIGVEIINSKTTSPTAAQYSALKNLIGFLKGKYAIKYVLGHKDIAPGRKDDPWNFDWNKIK